MLVFVAAGCAAPIQEAQPGRRPLGATGSVAPPLCEFLPVRVGVEFLPPAASTRTSPLPALAPRIAPGPAHRSDDEDRVSVISLVPTEAPADTESVALKLPWTFDRKEAGRFEDASEELTYRFVDDLIGEDRRRMQREFGTPVLMTRLRHLTSPSLWNSLDERESEEEASFLNDVARRLVRKPLRNVLKNFTVVADLETALEEFKADNFPLSGAYQEHRGRSGFGRVSMRLRLSDGSDPLELAYINWGLRVGTSKERLRLTYGYDFAEDMRASFRVKFGYAEHDTEYRADLRWEYDENTHVYLLLGDSLDFMSGPTAYTFLNTPLDGTSGILFYVEHLF